MKDFELTPDTHINIRPSGASGFLHCPRKYAATTLMGYRGWGSFATIKGSGTHKAGEMIWLESIEKGEKIINISQAKDAAAQEVEDIYQNEDIRFDKNDFAETLDNAKDAAVDGATVFCELAKDIDVPRFVEHTMEIDLGDNISVRGTADYISHTGMIEDIKTSSRKTTPQQHQVQLGIYAKLAKYSGIENANLQESRIQNIAFTKTKTSGYLLPFKLDEHLSSYLINDIKERIILSRQNNYEIDLLFPTNPSSFLCNPKYCAFWYDCEAVKGRRL